MLYTITGRPAAICFRAAGPFGPVARGHRTGEQASFTPAAARSTPGAARCANRNGSRPVRGGTEGAMDGDCARLRFDRSIPFETIRHWPGVDWEKRAPRMLRDLSSGSLGAVSIQMGRQTSQPRRLDRLRGVHLTWSCTITAEPTISRGLTCSGSHGGSSSWRRRPARPRRARYRSSRTRCRVRG